MQLAAPLTITLAFVSIEVAAGEMVRGGACWIWRTARPGDRKRQEKQRKDRKRARRSPAREPGHELAAHLAPVRSIAHTSVVIPGLAMGTREAPAPPPGPLLLSGLAATYGVGGSLSSSMVSPVDVSQFAVLPATFVSSLVNVTRQETFTGESETSNTSSEASPVAGFPSPFEVTTVCGDAVPDGTSTSSS
jgi:hypothetical protein